VRSASRGYLHTHVEVRSGTRTQRGPDVLQARAVFACVVPAEHQLAAGAQ
jgi:hypothetical protein